MTDDFNNLRRPAERSGITNAMLVVIILLLSTIIALQAYRIFQHQHQRASREPRDLVQASPAVSRPAAQPVSRSQRMPLRSGDRDARAWEDVDSMQAMHRHIERMFDDARRGMAQSHGEPRRQEDSRSMMPTLSDMQARIDHMFAQAFDDFSHFGPPPSSWHKDSGWATLAPTPGLDARRDGSNYTVTVSLPDLDKTNIHISVRGDVLRIAANIHERRESKTTGGTRQEAYTRRFERRIALPGPIRDLAEIRATYQGGLLKIVIPQYAQTKTLENAVRIQ